MEEIERKFLMKDVGFKWPTGKKIKQWYLLVQDNAEIRIREVDKTRYFLTCKIGSGISREEYETEISKEKFLKLYALDRYAPCVTKTRYKVGRWEIDVYENKYGDDVIVGEVELDRMFESLPEVPEGLKIVKEITYDERWKNKNIAQYGIPK